jgi:hypothetical protein
MEIGARVKTTCGRALDALEAIIRRLRASAARGLLRRSAVPSPEPPTTPAIARLASRRGAIRDPSYGLTPLLTLVR